MSDPAADGHPPADSEPQADAAPPPGDRLPVVRQWPADEVLDPATALAVECPGCKSPWRVHPDLGGFRLRCACGTWMQMPPRVQRAPALLPLNDYHVPAVVEHTHDDQGRLELVLKKGEVSDAAMPVHVAMAPGTVQHANIDTQKRWNNRAFLELGAMMTAFLLPSLLIQLFLDGQAQALALPFASMATGIVVVLIAALSSPYAFAGVRRARALFFAEAAAGAVALAFLALGWVHLVDTNGEGSAMIRGLRDTLGDGWTLFVISACPALFEELAFRGVVQGRFTALLGRFQGIVATGAAFGLCHGVTMGLPFHIGLGIWFCSLRERSASLLPGMLAHATYNALIVLLS